MAKGNIIAPQYAHWLDGESGKWLLDRTEFATRYRVTYLPFVPELKYVVRVMLEGIPFEATVTGSQLAAPGMERQANYPINQIGAMPVIYEHVAEP